MSDDKLDTATVTDKLGRTITVRRLKPIDRMRMIELVGADNAANDRYLGYATLAYSVVSIGEEKYGRAKTKLAIESVIDDLDDSGLDAVAMALKDNFMTEEERDEALKNG
jgi:hypothetical protein